MARRMTRISKRPVQKGNDRSSDRLTYANDVLDRATQVLTAIPLDPERVRFVRALTHIMTEWLSDPSCFGSDHKPLRLRLRARGPCLATLILRQLPNDSPEDVAAALVTSGAVHEQGGFYTPVKRYVSLGKNLENARTHSVASWRNHLDTIQYNIGCSDPNRRLVERWASNLHVPIKDLPRIHRGLRRRAGAFVDEIDSFLRDSQVPPGSEPTTCVGLSAFAWEDPMVTGTADLRIAEARPANTEVPKRSIDPTVLEAIERFIRVLNRSGVSQGELIDNIRQTYLRLAGTGSQSNATPNASKRAPVEQDPEIRAAPDVVAEWRDNSRYVDGKGEPMRLRRRGKSPSFKTLVRDVDPTLSPDRVLKYLLRTPAVRRSGKYYYLLSDTVILRGMSGPTLDRSLRGITYHLRTHEHNLLPANVAASWLERTVENAHVPVSKLNDWAEYLEREGKDLLSRANVFLRSLQLEALPEEPSVLAGAGLYRIQDDMPESTTGTVRKVRGASSRTRTGR